MPVLASFTYNRPQDWAIVRPYTWGFAVGWWNMTILQSGQLTILREIPFGGYRQFIRFKDWIWDWHAGTFNLTEVFQDFYVTAPGSNTPISAGSVILNWQFDSLYQNGLLVIANSPNGGYYYIDRFPPPPGTYWTMPFPTVKPTPFIQLP